MSQSNLERTRAVRTKQAEALERTRAARTKQAEAFAEYLKHLTTLSTGSILLIAAFLEKLFAKPVWKLAVVISLVGFMVSVLSSVIAYTILVELYIDEVEEPPQWAVSITWLAAILTWLGFLVGIVSLAIFAVKNITQ